MFHGFLAFFWVFVCLFFCLFFCLFVFFFKQKTAYEIRNCDWSSDVCSSDLNGGHAVSLRVSGIFVNSGVLRRLPYSWLMQKAAQLDRMKSKGLIVDAENQKVH